MGHREQGGDDPGRPVETADRQEKAGEKDGQQQDQHGQLDSLAICFRGRRNQEAYSDRGGRQCDQQQKSLRDVDRDRHVDQGQQDRQDDPGDSHV